MRPPITHPKSRTTLQGQDRDAYPRQREAGAAKAAELRRITAPYILRREKAEVLPGGSSGTPGGTTGGSTGGAAAGGGTGGEGRREGEGGVGGGARVEGQGPKIGRMGRKADVVVWLRLAPLQRHIYEAFLNSDAVRAALNSTRR